MQIRTRRTRFETLNAISNNSKGILNIQIQIRTIRKELEAFKCKFEPFERDSKHLYNHSNQIRSIRIQIRTLQAWLEALECKF